MPTMQLPKKEAPQQLLDMIFKEVLDPLRDLPRGQPIHFKAREKQCDAPMIWCRLVASWGQQVVVSSQSQSEGKLESKWMKQNIKHANHD